MIDNTLYRQMSSPELAVVSELSLPIQQPTLGLQFSNSHFSETLDQLDCLDRLVHEHFYDEFGDLYSLELEETTQSLVLDTSLKQETWTKDPRTLPPTRSPTVGPVNYQYPLLWSSDAGFGSWTSGFLNEKTRRLSGKELSVNDILKGHF